MKKERKKKTDSFLIPDKNIPLRSQQPQELLAITMDVSSKPLSHVLDYQSPCRCPEIKQRRVSSALVLKKAPWPVRKQYRDEFRRLNGTSVVENVQQRQIVTKRVKNKKRIGRERTQKGGCRGLARQPRAKFVFVKKKSWCEERENRG